MILSKLSLFHFRCFTSQTFNFSSGLSIISGRNGEGKTSVLEALYYSCYASSFRAKERVEMLSDTGEAACIKIEIKDNEESSLQCMVGFDLEKKSLKINDKTLTTHKEFARYIKILLLHQKDIDLIIGSPESRRTFLLQIAFLKDPSIISLIKELKKVLIQRKKVLQQPNQDLLIYKLWTEKLWGLSKNLREINLNTITTLNKTFPQILKEFSIKEFKVKYNFSANHSQTENSFDEFWKNFLDSKTYRQEFFCKKNLIGAQLDDFKIYFNSKEAKIFASRGQQKISVFILKLAGMIEIATELDVKSCFLFLIDDFFSELDQQNSLLCRQALSLLKNKAQIFLTEPNSNTISVCNKSLA